MSEPLEERQIGNVTVLFGQKSGKYPQGNSVLVRGGEETVVIDPSLGLVARGEGAVHADRILNSHCHEDHVAGNFLFPDAPCHLHEADLPGIQSLDAMEAIFGYPEPIKTPWRQGLVERFHFAPRPDALAYKDGDVFDLGGGVTIRAIHAPGHTRGHCLFHVEPDDVLFLGDIDLSSFGPYYGDARSRPATTSPSTTWACSTRATPTWSASTASRPRSPSASSACSPTWPSPTTWTRSPSTASSTARATPSPSPPPSKPAACPNTSTASWPKAESAKRARTTSPRPSEPGAPR